MTVTTTTSRPKPTTTDTRLSDDNHTDYRDLTPTLLPTNLLHHVFDHAMYLLFHEFRRIVLLRPTYHLPQPLLLVTYDSYFTTTFQFSASTLVRYDSSITWARFPRSSRDSYMNHYHYYNAYHDLPTYHPFGILRFCV